MNIHTLCKVIALAVSLGLPPAHAAAAQEASKSDRTEKKAAQQDAPKKADQGKPKSDTESCRYDAQGKHGPDRANFMTDCLRKRS